MLCARQTLTITDEGRVSKEEEKVSLVIKQPLQDWGLNLADKPSSKTQCPELSVVPAAGVTTDPSSGGERRGVVH